MNLLFSFFGDSGPLVYEVGLSKIQKQLTRAKRLPPQAADRTLDVRSAWSELGLDPINGFASIRRINNACQLDMITVFSEVSYHAILPSISDRRYAPAFAVVGEWCRSKSICGPFFVETAGKCGYGISGLHFVACGKSIFFLVPGE